MAEAQAQVKTQGSGKMAVGGAGTDVPDPRVTALVVATVPEYGMAQPTEDQLKLSAQISDLLRNARQANESKAGGASGDSQKMQEAAVKAFFAGDVASLGEQKKEAEEKAKEEAALKDAYEKAAAASSGGAAASSGPKAEAHASR